MKFSQIPKFLGILKSEWCPKAFVVSFKVREWEHSHSLEHGALKLKAYLFACLQLETDEEIVIRKAKSALEKYAVDAVVANLLHTRKDQVIGQRIL